MLRMGELSLMSHIQTASVRAEYMATGRHAEYIATERRAAILRKTADVVVSMAAFSLFLASPCVLLSTFPTLCADPERIVIPFAICFPVALAFLISTIPCPKACDCPQFEHDHTA